MDAITANWFLMYREFSPASYQARIQYALYKHNDYYDILMTEEGITGLYPPEELVDKFCAICDIRDRETYKIFRALLGRDNLADVQKDMHEREYVINDDYDDEFDNRNKKIVLTLPYQLRRQQRLKISSGKSSSQYTYMRKDADGGN